MIITFSISHLIVFKVNNFDSHNFKLVLLLHHEIILIQY